MGLPVDLIGRCESVKARGKLEDFKIIINKARERVWRQAGESMRRGMRARNMSETCRVEINRFQALLLLLAQVAQCQCNRVQEERVSETVARASECIRAGTVSAIGPLMAAHVADAAFQSHKSKDQQWPSVYDYSRTTTISPLTGQSTGKKKFYEF